MSNQTITTASINTDEEYGRIRLRRDALRNRDRSAWLVLTYENAVELDGLEQACRDYETAGLKTRYYYVEQWQGKDCVGRENLATCSPNARTRIESRIKRDTPIYLTVAVNETDEQMPEITPRSVLEYPLNPRRG